MITGVAITTTDVDEVHRISANGWDGQIFRMSRQAFLNWPPDRPLLHTAAVYVLYADHFDKSRHGKELYVGQTDGLEVRLDSHVSEKEYWNRVLVFSSSGDWMNVAFTHNIEHEFIAWAKHANRYEVSNENNGGTRSLGEADRKKLDDYLAGVRLVLKLADIDIFDLNIDGMYYYENDFCGKRYTATVLLESRTPKQVRIVAGSRFLGLAADELTKVNLNSAVRTEDHCVEFVCDAVVNVDESGALPKILGIHLTRFRSSCGVALRDAFHTS
jgi:hypothetical protein